MTDARTRLQRYLDSPRPNRGITPEIRAHHRAYAEREIKTRWPDHAREFPLTYLGLLLSAHGWPLEWTLWWNRNKYRPWFWLKARWMRLEGWWGAQKVRAYRIPDDAHDLGSEDELRQLVAHMRTLPGDYGRAGKLGRWWFCTPRDHLVNRAIIRPKTNPSYLAGAVAFRFDDYFFIYCALPYRFREIEPAVVMAIVFPEIEAAQWEWQPDEYETHYRG